MKGIQLGLSVVLLAGLAVACQADPEPDSVAQLLSRMEARAAQLESYEVIVEDEPDGKTHQFKLSFKQPNLVRLDAAEGQVTVQPNGQIRGRRGRGMFGKISVRLRRDDPRLLNTQGIPFWDSFFAATIARIQSQIKAGAAATLTVAPEAFKLELRSSQCVWTYLIDPVTLFFRETIRATPGTRAEVTRYRAFHPNVPLEPRRFEF